MSGAFNKVIEILPYKKENKSEWDAFISNSKNGIFLFDRDYMDYHSGRFVDHSLMFYKNGKLLGLLPANLKDNVLCSHAGLTFGGVISDFSMRLELMLAIFDSLIDHCRNENIVRIIYKSIPYIYHSFPADEDLYALFRHNSKLTGRNVTASIYMQSNVKFDESRSRAIKKAKNNKLIVKRSYDFKTYMQIVRDVLKERYGVAPVHTTQEIDLLANRFSDNIKLFSSFKDDTMLAGVLVYESKNVAHAQYIANSTEGKNIGALEIVFEELINNYYKDKTYFDFGISTEQAGQFLNAGLMAHKEGFGARAVMHDFYEISIN
jgi:hypothetical protein